MKNKHSNDAPLQNPELLLALNEAIANTPDPEALFRLIYKSLRPIFRFTISVIILPTSDPDYSEVFIEGVSVPEKVLALSPNKSKRVHMSDPIIQFDRNSKNIQRIDASALLIRSEYNTEENKVLVMLGIQEFLICPLLHAGKIIGHLTLGNSRDKKIQEKNLPLLKQVSRIIASAVVTTNTLSKLTAREQEAQRALQFTTAIMDLCEPKEFSRVFAGELQKLHPFSFFSIQGLGGEDANENYNAIQDQQEMRLASKDEIPTFDAKRPHEKKQNTQIRFYVGKDLDPINKKLSRKLQTGLRISIWPEENTCIHLFLGTDHPQNQLAPGLFEQVVPQIFLSFRNLYSWNRLQMLRERLSLENHALFEELSTTSTTSSMLGTSPAFRAMVKRARQVASTDTTVLLLGETGTGKEVLARFLHDLSLRNGKPMIRINCASLPSQLIESELFGHEKGSFTGAVEKRIGKFELAQGGTVFLDEIGELPIESQSKILRVLQERELERIGGQQVIPINVRLIAATNRNLEEEVRKGKFRADLFFRLNVFPITLPPLRERIEDIPLLAEAFLQKFAKQLGRTLRPLEHDEVDSLCEYLWPGNIRELEHIMESVAITSTGTTPNLRDFQKYLKPKDSEENSIELLSWDNLAKTHIIEALRRSGGRVGGAGGAAELLDLNAKTLDSKMRRYGIKRLTTFRAS